MAEQKEGEFTLSGEHCGASITITGSERAVKKAANGLGLPIEKPGKKDGDPPISLLEPVKKAAHSHSPS